MSKLTFLAVLLCPSVFAADAGTLSVAAGARQRGFEVERSFRGSPDPAGVLKKYRVDVPPFEVATYFAAFQRHDAMNPGFEGWPNGTNRVQPLPVRDFRELKNGGFFAVLKLKTGEYLALLPVAGASTVAWFSSSGADLVLNVGTLGTAPVQGDLPLLAWARSKDLYDASRAAWEMAIRDPLLSGSTRLRQEKQYPEVFRYLGWCSWYEYKLKIDEAVLLSAVRGIEESGVPIRALLVDDGHLDVKNRQLAGFDPDARKFPRGWGPLLAQRKPGLIRWMGVWLNFNGYWNGVAADNRLGAVNAFLAPVAKPRGAPTVLQPKPGMENSFAFYDAMIGAARRAGFDFIKIDNQSNNLALYRGSTQPAESAVANAKALELASAFHMDGLINCMAHGPANLFNTRVSAVTRCSEDYKVGDLARAKRHLHNSYGNMLWLGHTVWGDHDMFHSTDAVSGRMMAVSKALSGGPVYVSDSPKKFVREYIDPLSYRDGLLLRPLAPAGPLPESIFVDPFDEAKPFRAVAPLPNGVAAVAVYNLTDPETAVTGYIAPEDYGAANGLMQPRDGAWKIPAEGLVAYDWYERRAFPLAAKHTFSMPKFSDRLLLLCPVRNGWAVIGRTDKYLSPAGVELIENTASQLLLRLREGGLVTVWQKDPQAKVQSPDCAFRKIGDRLWRADVSGAGEKLVRVRR